MTPKNVITSIWMFFGMTLATATATGAEFTQDMRTTARMFVVLEVNDLKAYCATMNDAPYAEYLGRVCRSAVQNDVKKPGDCATARIALEAKADVKRCLSMSAAEFEKTVLSGREGSGAFVKKLAAQGIDSEKLLQEERANLHK